MCDCGRGDYRKLEVFIKPKDKMVILEWRTEDGILRETITLNFAAALYVRAEIDNAIKLLKHL